MLSKKVVPVFASTALMLGLAACQPVDEEEETETPAPVVEETEITTPGGVDTSESPSPSSDADSIQAFYDSLYDTVDEASEDMENVVSVGASKMNESDIGLDIYFDEAPSNADLVSLFEPLITLADSVSYSGDVTFRSEYVPRVESENVTNWDYDNVEPLDVSDLLTEAYNSGWSETEIGVYIINFSELS